MTRLHTDLSRIPISVAPIPATSGTTLGITDANAAYLPDAYPYWAVLVPTGAAPTRANAEIVRVTGGSSSDGTTTLTIVRARGIPVTTAKTVTTSFDIYDANSSEANIGLNSLIINETPSGTVNGSNAAFDTASAYVAGSIQVYRDGQLMAGGGADYTETDSNTITFTTAPATGSVILVTYQKTFTTSGNADTLDGYHANATPTQGNIPVLDSNAKLPNSILAAEAWTAFTPSWTNLTVGAGGTNEGYYKQIGKTVFFRVKTILGTSPSVGAAILALPVTIKAGYGTYQFIGYGFFLDGAATGYEARLNKAGTLYAVTTSSTYAGHLAVSSTTPFTWAETDSIEIVGTYEAN